MRKPAQAKAYFKIQGRSADIPVRSKYRPSPNPKVVRLLPLTLLQELWSLKTIGAIGKLKLWTSSEVAADRNVRAPVHSQQASAKGLPARQAFAPLNPNIA
jgi:hypothetical protein